MNDTEHQLFIGHQSAMDVMWDNVRPAVLAAELRTKDLPGFVRYAMLAGIIAAGAARARLVVAHMRELGLV